MKIVHTAVQKDFSIQRKLYSITTLTKDIKRILEDKFPIIWISGEISNFNIPGSGHFYFTLKDEGAQINAVIFRGQNRKLTFIPENGMKIVGLGRITVYEPKGSYQIILEYMEPKGIGSLQIAFEQLKSRLHEEGLFDLDKKKPIPYLPSRISIITSPTGAVVHDVIEIISRRYPDRYIEILPVKVQGPGADVEIVSALEQVNQWGTSDVVILARGGGSFEDLNAFNTEVVARAVFASKIPVISAIGHETDFTIADFVADLRAPTPSAAAELVVPVKNDLRRKTTELFSQLQSGLFTRIHHHRAVINEMSKRLIDPRKRIQDLRLKVDDDTQRLLRSAANLVQQKKERFSWQIEKLCSHTPLKRLKNYREKLQRQVALLNSNLKIFLNKNRAIQKELNGKLYVLNPKSILDRGYSITRTLPDLTIVRDPNQVRRDQNLEIIVTRGTIHCVVKGKSSDGEKNI